METIISYRDIEPTRKIKAQLQAVTEHYEMYFNNIVSVEWVIRRERNRMTASCRLHSKSGYYRATASSDDTIKSIHLVLDKLTKQRRRKKNLQKRGVKPLSKRK